MQWPMIVMIDFQGYMRTFKLWSSLMYLQGSHQVISKMTEPVDQRVRLDTGPNKGTGIIALIFPQGLCNTQIVITTFNVCPLFRAM